MAIELSEKLKNILDGLNTVEKDDLYRYLWAEHVKEDVESFAENIDIDIDDDIVEQVVYRYVYCGDYDCNLNYWTNIENLIKEEKENNNA